MVNLEWEKEKIVVSEGYKRKYTVSKDGIYSEAKKGYLKSYNCFKNTVFQCTNNTALRNMIIELLCYGIHRWETVLHYMEQINKINPLIEISPMDAYQYLSFKNNERKKFLKYVKQQETSCTIYVHSYQEECRKKEVIKQLQIDEKEYDLCQRLNTQLLSKDLYKKYKYFIKEVQQFQSLYEEIGLNIPFSDFRDLATMLTLAMEIDLQITWKCGEDISYAHSKMEKLYIEIKDKKNNEALSKYSIEMKDQLFFKDENFQVIIPCCVNDFKNEANQQSNCVYRCYLKQVVAKETNIVFIRNNNNINKSCITCEIDKNGEIRQYLGFGNRYRLSPEETVFKTRYQEFLNKSFKK